MHLQLLDQFLDPLQLWATEFWLVVNDALDLLEYLLDFGLEISTHSVVRNFYKLIINLQFINAAARVSAAVHFGQLLARFLKLSPLGIAVLCVYFGQESAGIEKSAILGSPA